MEDTLDDLRSEIVRDYLEQMPSIFIRWGSTITFLIVFSCIIFSWLIKYPTLVRADLKLTTQVEPKLVVARTDGGIEELLVGNHQQVFAGQQLAVLNGAARYADVVQLQTQLATINKIFERQDYVRLAAVSLPSNTHLGDIQVAYQAFQQQLSQLNSLLGKGYYDKRVQYLQEDIAELNIMNNNLAGQHLLYEKDVDLSENEFAVNRNLYKEKTIAKIDLDREESKLLAKKLPLKTIQTSILNNNSQIRLKQREIIELDKQAFELKKTFQQSLNTLTIAIDTWRTKYVLIAPAVGELMYSNNLQKNQEVKVGTELFQVSEKKSDYIGTILIPQTNLGKVKVGQRVLIKFQSYPFEEYGIVEGRISQIPQLSTNDKTSFFALVTLPNELKTNHNRLLSYKYGMAGSAEIITEDLRLIERIFYTIRKIF